MLTLKASRSTIVILILFDEQVKSQLLGMKGMFKHQYLKIMYLVRNKQITQLQVSEKYSYYETSTFQVGLFTNKRFKDNR